MEIRELKNESFESIQLYLNRIVNSLGTIGEPLFINVNGEEYLVSCCDNAFAIVNKDKDWACEFIDGKLYNFADGNILYQFADGDDINFVSKEKIGSGCLEQLYTDDLEHKLYYSQRDQYNNIVCYMYDYSMFKDNVNSFLTFSLTRNPSEIYIEHYKKGIFKKKKMTFTVVNDMALKHFKVINSRKSKLYCGIVPCNELLSAVSESSFMPFIPEDLIRILSDNSNKVKTLKKVTTEYNNYFKNRG